MKTFFIFFILVFGNGSCKILKDNILFLISNQTNDQNLITVFGVTRGRFGSNILIISPNNQSLENSLVVGIFTMNYINYQYRYQNFNFTSKPFQIDPNANGLLVPSQDPNYYPIGRDFNDYMLNITLKKNVFQSLFPETFWVFVGFTYSSPFDEYNFDTRFYPPFGENISFETQIQNETPFYQLEYPYLRLEILNVSVYVLYLIFLILLFIICIIFSQKEPLKSRGFIPYLSLMLQFIHLFTEFPFFFITLENAHFLCIPYYFFQSSASLLLTLLSLIHYFRLITYFNLNKRKDFLIQNSDPTDSKIYIFIKYMLKWYTMILIMFLFYLIISAIFLREYISDGYRCEKRDFHQIVYTSFVVLFSLIGILLIGYDLMSCLDKVRKFQCCDFWLEDTLLMRAEIYIFGGFFTLGFWIVSSAVSVNSKIFVNSSRPSCSKCFKLNVIIFNSSFSCDISINYNNI